MKLLFLGRKKFAARALKWAWDNGFEIVGVVEDRTTSTPDLLSTAKSVGASLFEIDEIYERINDRKIDFDVGVCFLYSGILKAPLINYPKYGVINFHPAPLPDYKGVAGYNLAILHKLDSWGVSSHYVDEGIDTGAIIEVVRFGINHREELAWTLEQKSRDYFFSLFTTTMKRVLEHGRLPTTLNQGGVYISRKQMEKMKEVHSGDDIDTKIRAFWFPPYSGAQTTIDGEKYTLVNEQVLSFLGDFFSDKN